jgi:uncharacterized protein involved in outer membrane biogenesis
MFRKFIYLFLALLILLSVIYLVASLTLKPFLLKELSRGLNNRRVEARAVSVSFPLNFEFKDLRLFNKEEERMLLTVEDLKIGLNPFSFFTQTTLLNYILLSKPDLKLEKSSSGELNISDLLTPSQKPKAKSKRQLLILRIEIKKGEIELLDHTAVSQPFTTKIDNLNLRIAKVYFPPTSAKTNFNLSFDLVNLAGQIRGSAETQGWVNIIKKDMSADLEIKNFDLTYFKPYYKSGFSSIQSGVLSFDSNLNSKDNDLAARCKLEVNSLTFAQENESSSDVFGVSVTNLIDYLKDSQGKISMTFTLHGKMDKPQELISRMSGVVIKSSLQKLVYSQMEKLFQKTTEQANGVTSKTQEKLEDIRKVLKGIFKPE